MGGVNLFADLTGEGSISETARTTASALTRRGIALTYNEMLLPYAMYRNAIIEYPTELPTGIVHRTNLFCYNLNLFSRLPSDWLARVCAKRHTIALWVWEMPVVPELWHGAFNKVDEVWCPSRFVQKSFQTATRKPVVIVPHPVELLPRTQPRAMFGLEEGRTVILCSFSAGSGEGRKNPWAVIEAYERAFGASPSRDKPLLVMKIQHSRQYPKLVGALAESLDRVRGHMITATYSRQDMHNLYYSADCYASLHRAEGFGLGLAEAMAAGKPVIATAYSGPCDYLTEQNGYPVNYQIRPVAESDKPREAHPEHPIISATRSSAQYYRPGMTWAEADIDHAAAQMVSVYEHPDAAREKGARAARDIRDHCDPNTVGAIMQSRIRTK